MDKFRQAKSEDGESFSQIGNRVTRERTQDSFKEMCVIAEQYLKAHRKSFRHRWMPDKSKSEGREVRGPERENKNRPMEKPNRFRSNIGQSRQYNPNTPKTGHTCWIYGSAKPYARDCPQNMHNIPIPGIKNRVGHNETTFKGGIKLTTKQVGNVRYVEDKNGKRFQLKEMAALASDQRKGMVVAVGQVSGRPDLVEVLRDTGCSTMVIRKDLCDPDDFTGETRGCVMMGGRVIEVPVVTKTVYTPYYTGIVEGVATDSPVYDLVIGNLLGARNQEDPDTSLEPSELKKTAVNAEKTADIDIISDEITDHVITGGVVTRSQSKDKPLRPLKVAKT